MNTWCEAVDDYLELRRSLGFKLVNYGACLREFVSFLEQKKASHVTTALAVQFAMLHLPARTKGPSWQILCGARFCQLPNRCRSCNRDSSV